MKPRSSWPLLALGALWFATSTGTASADPGFAQPLRHGVVFWQAETPEEAVRELEAVKADGFTLIKLASWVWTLPKPGSEVERVAEATLDWCDRNDFSFYLLHNIQYGSPGEGGDLDQAWEDPLAAAPLLQDWARVLASHDCVTGVILGNEVGPRAGTPEANPRWWAGFVEELRGRYGGDVAVLNDVWGTDFGTWDAVGTPPEGSPGRVDLRRFATEVYARFYGTLFDEVLRPALGDIEYGTKTGGDPILHRHLERFSMLTWDDVLANYPQWRIKTLCDVGRALDKPVFNSELHLYHDTYAFNQSAAMSRYRYFTSALNGETTTASFAWRQWSEKPETAAIHRQTPGVLAELARVRDAVTKLADAAPRLHVLLTPNLAEGEDREPDAKPAAEALYAEMAALGIPWRFVCEQDVPTVESGTLVATGDARPEPSTVQAIAALPTSVEVVCVGARPELDSYGQPLPAGLSAALAERSTLVAGIADLDVPDDGPGAPYGRIVSTDYLWWSEEKGHFSGPMGYPALEARRVRDGDDWLVAVINHATSGETLKSTAPWVASLRPGRIVELTGEQSTFRPGSELEFASLSVRILRYE